MRNSLDDCVAALVRGETSFETGVLEILTSQDFLHSRAVHLQTSRYAHWVKAFAKRPGLDEDLVNVLDFRSSEQLQQRSLVLVGDFIAQDAALHRTAFSMFTSYRNRSAVLETLYLPAGLAFLAADVNRASLVPRLFATAAETLRRCTAASLVEKLLAFLAGLWTHYHSLLTPLSRELVRLLLPLSAAPQIRKFLKVAMTFSRPSLVPCASLVAASVLEDFKSGQISDHLLVGTLARVALDAAESPWTASALAACEDASTGCAVTLCDFRFAISMDLLFPDSSLAAQEQALQFILTSSHFQGHCQFIVSQTKKNPLWRATLLQSLRRCSSLTKRLARKSLETSGKSEVFALLNSCLDEPLDLPVKTDRKRPLESEIAREPELAKTNQLSEYIKRLRRM